MSQGGPGLDRLVRELVDARDDGGLARQIAVLWTWLEQYLIELGSLREKPPALRAAALKEPPFVAIDDETIDTLRRNPIRNAAVLLARIAFSIESNEQEEQLGRRPVVEARGVDGEKVIVAVRAPFLGGDGDDDVPPEAIEHPSLSALAPRLIVSPVFVNRIRLKVLRPEGPEWDSIRGGLERGLLARAAGSSGGGSPGGEGPTLEVHLDPLRTAGLTGMRKHEALDVGWFDEDQIQDWDEDACIAAAEGAVEAASGRPSVLVLPELAATPKVLAALASRIREESEPPLLTVVGLYHETAPDPPVVDEGLVDPGALAPLVNHAVVLGPSGEPLWSHRKLTCAQAHSKTAMERGEPPIVEDIRLGDTLTVVSTPIGTLTVAICLDSFASSARERIASSPADVLIVPSLSPEVHRHRDSLQQLVQKLWGIAFVCNRAPLDGDGQVASDDQWTSEDNRSFWAMQRKPLELPSLPGTNDHPSFVFSLAQAG